MLFFSRGISLAIWRDSGLLEREIAPYQKLLSHLDGITFLTYGGHEDQTLVAELKGAEVLHNRWNLPTDFFGLLVPFLYRSEMRSATVFKTNQINGWWVAGLAKFVHRRPLILRCGYLLSQDQERKRYSRFRIFLISLLERWAFKYADAVVVSSPQMKGEAIRRYGISPEEIRVIPNSVNIDLFRPLSEIERIPGRLGFVGRLSPEKDLPLLLESVAGIKGVSLLIVGDGELRSQLEGMASKNGIDATFCGIVPNYRLPRLLNTCEAFVLPSRWEGMPKALLEAMACGLPVIGTDVPGIRDIIEHGKTGYLCDSSVGGLKSAILTVLDDISLKKRLGMQAREFIINHFSLDQVVTKELELLSILEKR